MATRTEGSMSPAEFEANRLDKADKLLAACIVFLQKDTAIIGHLERIADTVANQIVQNPQLVLGGAGRRVVLAGEGIRAAADDVTGADAWDDIQRIIDIIKSALGDEKPFIQRIIEKILDL